MDYKYRLIFTYPATPAKIPLPNIFYTPKTITFNFEDVLGGANRDFFINLAAHLDLSRSGKVVYKEEFYQEGVWAKKLEAALLARELEKKYNLETPLDLDEEKGLYFISEEFSSTPSLKEDWRMFLQGHEGRWPGLDFVVNSRVLKNGYHLIY